jgi:hypothetical protein
MTCPRLVDVGFDGTGRVELFFDDRRILFDPDPPSSRIIWVIASSPAHDRDGAGYVDEEMTTSMVVARGTSSS